MLYFIFLGHTHVSQNTLLGLFWPMGSHVAYGMRMTVSSMFYVLIATPLGLHGGSFPYQFQSMVAYILKCHIREYDDNIP